MKIFSIKDAEFEYGYLFYDIQYRRFYILLNDNDYWNVPMYLDSFLSAKDRFIGSNDSLEWVSTRIVSKERQNIASILNDNKLTEYDEYKLLLLNKGICPQDDAYIEECKIEQLPIEIKKLLGKRISDFFPISKERAYVVFHNGEVKIVNMKEIMLAHKECKLILDNPEALFLFSKDFFGFELCIHDVITIPYHELYDMGVSAGVSEPELDFFLMKNLVTTNEAMEILSCSRQNLDDLVKRGKLTPVYDLNRVRLYKRSEIMTYNGRS